MEVAWWGFNAKLMPKWYFPPAYILNVKWDKTYPTPTHFPRSAYFYVTSEKMPKNPVLVSSVDRISLFLPRRGVHVAALMHAGGFEFVRKMRHQLMMLLMRRKMMRSLFKRIWVQWPKYKQAFFRMKLAKIWLKFNILIFV